MKQVHKSPILANTYFSHGTQLTSNISSETNYNAPYHLSQEELIMVHFKALGLIFSLLVGERLGPHQKIFTQKFMVCFMHRLYHEHPIPRMCCPDIEFSGVFTSYLKWHAMSLEIPIYMYDVSCVSVEVLSCIYFLP